GSDIYFRPHRNNEHSALFLDDLSMAKARKVAAKYACAVVSTSYNNTQLWLGTAQPLSKEERKNAQKYLSDLGYSDPRSVSGDHLGRLPGFFSQKRHVWVNAVLFSSAQYYQPQKTAAVPHMAMRARRRASWKGNPSQSEREFGWVMEMLRNGRSLDFITNHLTRTAEQRGKRNPEYYANLTIRNALKEFHKVV
ncbi:MAG: hypothetical protein HQK66_11440, partial [Desulfamplus sp.]|nr:hypothetical protein [Desulfamplus sp.]